ncbi:MAG: hypothetical protein ACRDJV_01885 [Actinomycetota bacterium]
MDEPAPGSGQMAIIDLERRDLLMILRTVQKDEVQGPAEPADDEIAWID